MSLANSPSVAYRVTTLHSQQHWCHETRAKSTRSVDWTSAVGAQFPGTTFQFTIPRTGHDLFESVSRRRRSYLVSTLFVQAFPARTGTRSRPALMGVCKCSDIAITEQPGYLRN